MSKNIFYLDVVAHLLLNCLCVYGAFNHIFSITYTVCKSFSLSKYILLIH